MLLRLLLISAYTSLFFVKASEVNEAIISALESPKTSSLKSMEMKMAWDLFTSTFDWETVNLDTLQSFLSQGLHPNTALNSLLSDFDNQIEAIAVCIQNGGDIRDVFFQSLPNTISLKSLKVALRDLSPFLDQPSPQRTLYSCLFRVDEEDMAEAVRIIAKYELFEPAGFEIRSLLGRPYDDFSKTHVHIRCECIAAMLEAGLSINNTILAFALVHGCQHPRLQGAAPKPSTDRFWFDIVKPLFDLYDIDGIKDYVRASRARGASLSSPVTGRYGTFKSVLPAVFRLFPRDAHIPILALLLQTGDGDASECGMHWAERGLDEMAYPEEQITYRKLMSIAKLYDSADDYID